MADNSMAGRPSAGQGRSAQLIATGSGQASPGAPFVIEHRGALIYLPRHGASSAAPKVFQHWADTGMRP